jgi:hypothetical protein
LRRRRRRSRRRRRRRRLYWIGLTLVPFAGASGIGGVIDLAIAVVVDAVVALRLGG